MIKKGAAIILLSMCTFAFAEDKSPQEAPFVNLQVTYDTDVHFNEMYCTECHMQIPVKGGETFLRFNEDAQTCRCHGYTTETYTHPVGMPPSAAIKENMPPDLPLAEGKITCNTCHAIAMQCNAGQQTRRSNKQFLRFYSPKSRTALCYQCHKKTDYERLSPHRQLDENGKIIEVKCLYCHKFKPDEKTATLEKQRSDTPGTVEFVAELSTLCFRCHFRQTKQHIITVNHLLVKPPPKIRANMRLSEKMRWIILPLDDAGSLTCATCHNPHERGVIPAASPGAKGASEKSRLRVTLKNNKICKACHGKR